MHLIILAFLGCLLGKELVEAGYTVRDLDGTFTFVEPFTFVGNHATTQLLNNKPFTTVWWNEHDWVTSTDTGQNAVFDQSFGLLANPGTGHHVDLHKAFPEVYNATLPNDHLILGGDGSPGIGIIHLQFEGASSAQLRNPLKVSIDPAKPSTIKFWAPRFVTTGHWWEISLTPATITPTPARTAIPGGAFETTDTNQESISGCLTTVSSPPLGTCTSGSTCLSCEMCCDAGPRAWVAEDSINIVARGTNDCPTAYGWNYRYYVARAVNGRKNEYFRPFQAGGGNVGTYLSDPSQVDLLFYHVIQITNNQIQLFADFNIGGTNPTLLETWPVSTPWDQVYVSFVGIAYQSDHHPFSKPSDYPTGYSTCGYQGMTREIKWRNITINPVVYSRTTAFPNVNHTDHSPIKGYTAFDIRDTQHYGCSNVSGLLNVNNNQYNDGFDQTYSVFCSNEFFCQQTTGYQDITTTKLNFVMPSYAVPGNDVKLNLLYDIHGSTVNISLYINNVLVIKRIPTLVDTVNGPNPTSYPGSDTWLKRSVFIPYTSSASTPIKPYPNVNTLSFSATQNSNDYMMLDRIQFEYLASPSLSPPSAVDNCAAGKLSSPDISSQQKCKVDPKYNGLLKVNLDPCALLSESLPNTIYTVIPTNNSPQTSAVPSSSPSSSPTFSPSPSVSSPTNTSLNLVTGDNNNSFPLFAIIIAAVIGCFIIIGLVTCLVYKCVHGDDSSRRKSWKSEGFSTEMQI